MYSSALAAFVTDRKGRCSRDNALENHRAPKRCCDVAVHGNSAQIAAIFVENHYGNDERGGRVLKKNRLSMCVCVCLGGGGEEGAVKALITYACVKREKYKSDHFFILKKEGSVTIYA